MLTPPQIAALKAAADADPTASALMAAADDIGFAAWLNEVDLFYYVWRSAVSAREWRAAIIGGGGAAQLDALTASKRESLLWAVSDSLDPTNANVRTALDDFCGTQNTLKAAVQAAQKRNATRAEKLLAVGTGSLVSPATMTFEGEIDFREASTVRAS